MISAQIWLEIHCFSIMSWPLSWLIMHENCILMQQKLMYLLPSLTVFYINQLDLSSCLRHRNLSPWTSVFWAFSFKLYAHVPVQYSVVWCRGILSPYSTVLLPVTVVLSIGCGGSIGHAHMTSWGGKVMLGLWSNLEKLFGPQHICSYIWLFPDRPCTEGIISKWVWYIACRLYHI